MMANLYSIKFTADNLYATWFSIIVGTNNLYSHSFDQAPNCCPFLVNNFLLVREILVELNVIFY